jgi:hypothetical protein
MEKHMTFKVEANVPLDQPKLGSAARKYPFNEMKPGDSFLINGGADPKKVAGAATSFGRANNRGWKFATRNTPEGYRCWRVK